MYYFIFPVLFIVYLELLGRVIINRIKVEKLEFNFLIGLLVVFSYTFIVGIPAVFLGLSFGYLLICYSLFFVFSCTLILIDIRKINFKLNGLSWLCLFVIVAFVLKESLDMSLGDTNGFDSQFYLNMIVDNIQIDRLFSIHPYFGTASNAVSMQYQFQSYYHLLSVVSFGIKTILDFIHYDAYYLPIIVFFSQILFYFIFTAICIESIRLLKIKNVFLILLYFSLMILLYQFRYYHLEFAYIGNSYRFILLGLLLLFTKKYFDSRDRVYLFLILLSVLALNATSSSSSFIILMYLYGFFFVAIDFQNDCFRYIPLVGFASILNIVLVFFRQAEKYLVLLLFVLSLFFVLFRINDTLTRVFRRYHLKYYLSVVLVVGLSILSYKSTAQLFDFKLYIYNIAEIYDMNWNYFYLYNKQHAIYNLSILVLVILYLWKNKDRSFKTLLVVIGCMFFQPFYLPLLNKYNAVWARAFDLLLNPLTILLLINQIRFKYKRWNSLAFLLLLVFFYKHRVITLKPIYWHNSFRPNDNYNKLFKTNQDYVDIFHEINYLIKIDRIQSPKIITDYGLIRSVFKDAKTLYGRENEFNGDQKDLELYKIFYPSIYYGDVDAPKNPDLENMCQHLRNSDYHFIIQDKKILYRNPDTTFWYGLYYKIEECGYYPVIDTESYRLYKLYQSVSN